MLRSEKGFTLIELVMVIVILAILAAVAIPRFINLQDDARISTAKGIGGAIAGAANILHAQYILRGTNYEIGTMGGPDTGVLFNANISGGPTVTGAPATAGSANGAAAIITINVGGTTLYTMTFTSGSNTLGPRVQYNF